MFLSTQKIHVLTVANIVIFYKIAISLNSISKRSHFSDINVNAKRKTMKSLCPLIPLARHSAPSSREYLHPHGSLWMNMPVKTKVTRRVFSDPWPARYQNSFNPPAQPRLGTYHGLLLTPVTGAQPWGQSFTASSLYDIDKAASASLYLETLFLCAIVTWNPNTPTLLWRSILMSQQFRLLFLEDATRTVEQVDKVTRLRQRQTEYNKSPLILTALQMNMMRPLLSAKQCRLADSAKQSRWKQIRSRTLHLPIKSAPEPPFKIELIVFVKKMPKQRLGKSLHCLDIV